MSRTPFQIFALLNLLMISGRLDSAAAEPTRPNIIVVMADDMGFSDLGCYGGEIKTPTVDQLAAEGARFTQFYNCNKCGPSRAALMTGCYPWKVGQAKPELFDLSQDRNESKNLAAQFPEKVLKMKQRHAELFRP